MVKNSGNRGNLDNLKIYEIWFWGFFRFDGLDVLRRWSGKKIMFVGDSLSLNMWESLSCMLQSSVPNAKTTFVRRDSISSVFFQVLPLLYYPSFIPITLFNFNPNFRPFFFFNKF